MLLRFLKVFTPVVLLVLCMAHPAKAQYYKSGKDVMVRIMVRYDGPDISPYLTHDKTQIALKEASAARVQGILQSVGAKVGYSFRHLNIVSASIPIIRLGELSKFSEIVEITKDRNWETQMDRTHRTIDFNPFTATPEERKAWIKAKVAEVKQNLANRDLREQAASLKNRVTAEAKRLPESNAKKRPGLETAPEKPFRVAASDGSIDPGQLNAFLSGKGITPANYLFYNHGQTNASQVWKDGNQGEGVIVAVIDSGTYSAHPFLTGSVIGGLVAPGLAALEADADIDGDGNPDGRTPSFDSILNGAHGTGTATMIAGHGSLTFSNSSRFLKAVQYHASASVIDNGDGTSSVLLFGTAPRAKIFAIKVFPYSANGGPSSIVLAGMEAAIDKKQDYLDGKPSGVNITVANMSLGGADFFEGYDVEDKLADSMVKVGIQPVISAGNAGPAPFTISSPGASLKAITVAAASDRIHHRIFIEGLEFPELQVGDATKVRIANQFIPADFSSHGPLTTGYGKPDLTAEGNFCLTGWLFDTNGDGLNDEASAAIVGGTSFSAPTTAGAVALLQAYAKAKGLPLGNRQPIKAALLNGARFMPGMDEDEVGKGFLDVKNAADQLAKNPDASAGPFNTRKNKFKGVFLPGVAGPSYSAFIAYSNPLKPGEQDDFLIPSESANNDETLYRYILFFGENPQRSEPIPGVIRDLFDPVPDDGIAARTALYNNTEIYYADGINTGFSDGDYIIGSLNMVDTYLYSGAVSLGVTGWFPEQFPYFTLQATGFIPDPFYLPTFFVPITNNPSSYGLTNSTQNFGSGGRPDYDRLTFRADSTNDSVSPVSTIAIILDLKRSGGLPPSTPPFTLGTPSFTGTLKQNELKELTINLPTPIDGYFFRMSFPYGWNAYKFPADPLGQGLTGIKRRTADLDMYVFAPDGSLLNESGFPGLFQAGNINDVEGVRDFALNESGKYQILLVGFGVKGLPNNTVPFEVRIWDGFFPIIP